MNFVSGAQKYNSLFKYVNLDIWGLTRVETHWGGFYFLIINYNFYKRVWVHILKYKRDTYENINEWHTLVGNKIRTKIKIVRFDNNLKFVLEHLNEFCKKQGIKIHIIIIGTPK